ncbi:transcriptional regulator family: Fungal Specific TF [Penicillium roqueforti]|uniref:transcriptional regulator family: Fungal Specific TF n=1 Tax=Penicillium roqueforti TaxID=5082 RepID=UPI00190C557C|nr:transcriptional regulator family: Fungal Specific TF [Penicillium roqueforti]KAF9241429.1 transcriptional regulator family: Fungal Specific TF [Penicillium roqueforti]KAI1830389.1 transcriptional regulator family: Fungal Specific TF [Penicillium roqueforti]KAI2670915.1 transcriptional regulator family: Fungal Specific TF [Penicillium roqueforti]KAI2674604.1 transcriptional regulator family: Fungal Specific TF [Penicillium roqueforti]KAI2696282.1 transcriptional regulator family: Fungal Spec
MSDRSPSRYCPEYPEPPSHAPLNPYPSRDTHGDGRGHEHGPRDTHPSFGMGLDSNQSPDPHDPPGDAKRSRACEPCRQLKVRCDPDPAHPEGSCKRCAKARRTCVVTAPTRKRQKKTDSRVAELERKIDALTATLQASNSTSALFSGGAGQRDEQLAGRRWIAGSKRQHTGELKDPSGGLLAPRYSRPGSPSAEQIPSHASKHWRRPVGVDSAPPPPKHEAGNEFADMIDRGIIDYKTASAAFDRYIHQMAPELPFVVFPPGTTMGEVRRNKPYLFLAIIAAAVAVFNSDAQPILVNETYRLIAEQVVVKGQKSLELVQTIMVCSIWYLPPDNFDEIKFYSLIHMAVVMAMELGLNRRISDNRRSFSVIRELIIKKPTGPAFDPKGPEARRTWVGCYFLSVQMSAALRRVHLVTWQPYMDECLQILETHPDALPSDRNLKWWIKLGSIMEDAGNLFSEEDPGCITTFADSKVWYNIKMFEDRLAQWREEVPRDVYTEPMVHAEHVLNLFVHGSAMCVDYNTVNNSPSQDDLHNSSIAIDALSTAIRCIHESLDVICTINIDRLISLPTTSLARTSYPVVSLIKIYSLFMSPDSRIGQILDVQSLKLDYYLDKVIAHYRAAAARDGGRAAARFGNIMVLLRNWFIKKRDQGDHGRELKEVFSNDQKSSDHRQARHNPDTPNAVSTNPRARIAPGMTPLHFLSEVAMGDPAHRANNSNSQRSIAGQSYSSNHSPSSTVNPMPTPSSSNFVPDPPQTSWSSSSSYPTTLPSSDSNHIETRGYYQPYPSTEITQNYPDLPSSTQTQGYPDMSTVAGVQLAPPMGMAPEVGMDPNFGDPWFTLGNMMDEGLFTFPLSFDGNFGLF